MPYWLIFRRFLPTFLICSFAVLVAPKGRANLAPPSNSLTEGLKLAELKAPSGFKVDVIARIPNAREMTLAPSGTLFVGSRDEGKVFAVQFGPNWTNAQVTVLAKDQKLPVGVAYRGRDLYFSTVSKIFVLKNVEKDFAHPPSPLQVGADFPPEEHHGWKFIAFGPDGKLYIPIGAPCNLCDEKGHANLMRMNADGSGREVYASGIRNTVGFDWEPTSKELWFTDNGRDLLGDDVPPDELNRAPKAGMHFGYPYCHAGEILDPEFGKGKSCADYTAPAAKLGAHVAALGMRFYRGTTFPAEYRGQIFVAEHGSWNRSKKSGYQVLLARVKDGKITKTEPFIEGFKVGESAWGRPVDVENVPDGSLLISDDEAGAIYRVSYEGKMSVKPMARVPVPRPNVAPEIRPSE